MSDGLQVQPVLEGMCKLAASGFTTIVHKHGRVMLPKMILYSKGWKGGARLEAIQTEDGVMVVTLAPAADKDEWTDQ